MAGRERRRAATVRSFLAVFAIVVATLGVAPGEPAWAVRPDAPASQTAQPGAVTPVQNGLTQCVPTANATGTTCTNTYSGETGYDYQINGGAQSGVTPTVTVDQTSNMTNQMVNVSWTGFTPSFDTSLVPGYVQGNTYYGVAVFECKGVTPKVLQNDCNINFVNSNTNTAGAKPNAVDSYTMAGPKNNPNNFSDCSNDPGDAVCGTGFTSIQIQTYVQNSDLGCGKLDKATNAFAPCSVVVVPLWGGNGPAYLKNPTAVPNPCDDHSVDAGGGGADFAQDISDGFNNACAWRDRIVVPIYFAPTPSAYCSSNTQFNAEGSAMLERVMQQWQPAWCNGRQNKVDFNYNSGRDEYEARNGFLSGNGALSASSDVALVTDPASADQTAGSTRKFTYAPISDTGIVIAYYVDNITRGVQQPITNLVLNARLVAKLLTQSYSLDFNQCSTGQTAQSLTCDPAVASNPIDIFHDPEFLFLNPSYTAADFFSEETAFPGSFLPTVLLGNSDMTYELTRWVESDPEARSFLQGRADPYGMRVNTYYETEQTYPVSAFSVLDPGFTVPDAQVQKGGVNTNITMQGSWNPVNGLDNVAASLANWDSSADSLTPVCNDSTPFLTNFPPCHKGIGWHNPRQSPQAFPNRALFAVMDQGTAAAFRFPTATLVNSAGNPEAPTFDAESAALGAMKTNPDKITQYQDFANTSPNAYPLTEVQYAMVPTCGLTTAKTRAVSSFLQNVAGSQFYGNQVGQIPPFGGYLALTDAQKTQTLAAAQLVSSQACTSPPPDHTVSGQTPPPTTGTTPPSSPATTVPGSGASPSPSGHSIASSGTPTPSSGPSKVQIKAIDLGQKSSDDAGLAHYMLPIILILGALLLLGGPLTYAFSTGALRLPPMRRGLGGGPGPSAGGPGQPEPPGTGDPSAGGSAGIDG